MTLDGKTASTISAATSALRRAADSVDLAVGQLIKPAARARRDWVGWNIDQYGPDGQPGPNFAADLALAPRLGSAVRLDVPWNEVEKADGTRDWTWSDRRVWPAAAAGLDVLLLPLPRCPRVPKGADWTAMPADAELDAWASFVAQATARYSAVSIGVEVGNEPNGSWSSKPVDPAQYAKVLTAAAPGIRAADLPVIFAGLGPAADSGDNQSPPTFLANVAAALVDGLEAHVDAIALHMYNDPASRGKPWSMWTHLDTIRKADPDLPVWATELGQALDEGITVDDQARIVVAQLDALEKAGVPRAFIYALTDGGGGGGRRYGTRDARLAPRPAFSAARRWIDPAM